MTKLDLISMIKDCDNQAEIIIQYEGCNFKLEDGRVFDIKETEIYKDTIFIIIN